jgi:hypothetical protein
MSEEVEFLKHVYQSFNARDMDRALAAMHDDVIWANGMEGGYVYGRDGVRTYWTRQWAIIDPHVEPVGFTNGLDGEVVIEVIRWCATLTAVSSRIKWPVMYFESRRDWSSDSISARHKGATRWQASSGPEFTASA